MKIVLIISIAGNYNWLWKLIIRICTGNWLFVIALTVGLYFKFIGEVAIKLYMYYFVFGFSDLHCLFMIDLCYFINLHLTRWLTGWLTRWFAHDDWHDYFINLHTMIDTDWFEHAYHYSALCFCTLFCTVAFVTLYRGFSHWLTL